MLVQDDDPASAEREAGEGMPEEAAAPTDEIIPPQVYDQLPVVALGGSAGGIEALIGFFSSFEPPTGHAFAVILHLSPDHESSLAEILQRHTSMAVVQVAETAEWQEDTVYVIPPRKALRSTDGRITVTDLRRVRQRHYAVDLFFRSLADTHGPHAIAVVLSGADGDGAIGIKRIKERGGLTIVQDPDETTHAGMPRTSIATGMVDWILPVKEIMAKVIEYRASEKRDGLPAGPIAAQAPRDRPPASSDEASVRDVLGFLKSRTGRDFGSYKRATVQRRIGRRMQVNGVSAVADYLSCLRTRPGEAGALLQDLLISVTNFFRDVAAFTVLEAHVPALFRNKGPNGSVRVWVPACATGEEAYSIAMLLMEHARTLDTPPVIQVFATDLDDEAIRIAREGIYPATIEVDVSEARLKRYFVKEHGCYRVGRDLRECVLFAVHDVLKDSPFSRVQLVSCRNLLIYLDTDAKRYLLEVFHFALRQPGALLFLGASETIEDSSLLFSEVDKRNRLFAKRGVRPVGLPIPTEPGTLARVGDGALGLRRGALSHGSLFASRSIDEARPLTEPRSQPPPWSEIHLQLIECLAPPSVVIDGDYEVLHLSASAGSLLQLSGGEPTRNLLKLLHPALRLDARAALAQAANTGKTVELPPILIDRDGIPVQVTIRVHHLKEVISDLLLVTFRQDRADGKSASGPVLSERVGPDLVASQLDRELERLKAHLRDTVEQYEASTEELEASNEELQAMNEELRSATEELETSREELQSINEELVTVNHELKSKVQELANANSDMHNLMDATAIATVFLDRDLRITRYTPSAVGLFSLIATDVGRPLSDLTSNLNYPKLVADASSVLERLIPIEREVGEDNGRWYLARIRPYRTLEDRIAGVVLTFVDVTERKTALEALRLSEERFSAIVSQAPVGVVQTDLDGRISYTNELYCEMVGRSSDEVRGASIVDFIHEDDRGSAAPQFTGLVRRGQAFEMEKRVVRPDGVIVWLQSSVSLLTDQDGRPSGTLAVCSDVGERRAAEQARRESEERLRLMVENAVEYAIFSIDLESKVTAWSTGAQRLFGYREDEIIGRSAEVIFTEEDRQSGVPAAEMAKAIRDGIARDERIHRRRDGSRFWASGAMMAMRDPRDEIVGLVKVVRDQSDERAATEALEKSKSDLTKALQENELARAALELANQEKDRFLAVLSHELRNPLASIVSATDALAGATGRGNENARAVEIIQRQSAAMNVLLGDLLDLSRLRLGRLELHKCHVRLTDVIDSAIEAVKPMIAANRHQLGIDLPAQSVVIHADPLRLSQVVTNLLSNAAKFTPEGGAITLKASVEDDALTIIVTDTGVGMHPDLVKSMFEMFAQGPQLNRMTGGLGIGLALVKFIVGLHGGSVEGASAGPGLGSRFSFSIPIGAKADEPAEVASSRIIPRTPRPLRIVVADDNEDVIWPLVTMLRHAGHEVLAASGGAQAIELADGNEPDVMILDIGMPGIGGHEVARRIRRRPYGQRLVLIALTGWGQEADKQAALEAGFDVHFVKPVVFDTLTAYLAERFDGSGAAAS